MSPSLWWILTTLSWEELLHTHTRTSYESPTSVLIRIQERWRCPALCSNSCHSLFPSSAQYDRRVNTDAEQQTKGDRFISGDSPACCRNQTNSTCNYLAEINWQREERRENISCFDHGYVFDPDSVFDKNAIFGSRCFWWNLPTLMC